jgi:hypothetical protein
MSSILRRTSSLYRPDLRSHKLSGWVFMSLRDCSRFICGSVAFFRKKKSSEVHI